MVGWQPRPDVSPWLIPEPMDWSANPYNDRNWFAQLHGWRMMDPYLQAYRSRGAGRYLSRLIPWMTSWPAFRDSAPRSEQKTFGALGGMRATRLALVLDAWRTGAIDLSRRERDTLYDLARRDAEWLAMPGHIAMMNHAYFQIFGIELLCRVLSDEPWATGIRQTMLDTFDKLIPLQFTEEGVHVENSPCYHFYAVDQLNRAGAIEKLGSPETRRLLERAAWVLPWLVFPDGLYADVGDSTGPGTPLSDPGNAIVALGDQSFAVAPFWRSGYGIVRSLPSVPPEQASMLLLVGTSRTHIHSHADKLSFELFEFGKRVIVDSGKYGYIRDPMRNYVESAVAHNTVGLATDPIRRMDVGLGGTTLYEPRVEGATVVVGGQANWSTKRYAFEHKRDLTYAPGKLLKIQDTLSSDQPQQYASRLHFDRSLVIEQDGRVLTADVDGHTMRVEMVDEDAQITVHRGEEEPIKGWQSVGYLKMEPTTMVEAICTGQHRTITWVVSFDRYDETGVTGPDPERRHANSSCQGLPVLITNFNRVQLLTVLPKGGKVLEVGTYMGGFAVKMRHLLKPSELHLVDPWALDEDDEYTRSYGGERSTMHSAYEQVCRVFSDDIAEGRVTLHRDYSARAADTFGDHSFDLIYVDAMHDYENVLADLLAYKDKVKPDGFLLGHDFSNTHMGRAKKFGVIRAVREFVAREPFELVLITNEAAPSYLLARSGNETTLPVLRSDLLNHKACSLIEVEETLLDRFEQVGVTYADGRKSQMIKLG